MLAVRLVLVWLLLPALAAALLLRVLWHFGTQTVLLRAGGQFYFGKGKDKKKGERVGTCRVLEERALTACRYRSVHVVLASCRVAEDR